MFGQPTDPNKFSIKDLNPNNANSTKAIVNLGVQGKFLASNDSDGLYKAITQHVQESNIDKELALLRAEAASKARDPA